MDLLLLVFLFLVSLLLTITVTVGFRNRGPWGNPMLYFLVLFMTSWTILTWTGPVETENGPLPYITAGSLAILISILLAAVKINVWEKEKIRKIGDHKVVNVKAARDVRRIMPNGWFRGLLITETSLIMLAYFLKLF